MKRVREEVYSESILNIDLWVLVIWESNPVKKYIDEDWGLTTENKIKLLKHLVFFKRISKSFKFNEIMEVFFIRIFDAFLSGERVKIFIQKLKESPKETRELAKEFVQNEIEIMKLNYLKDRNFYIIHHFDPPIPQRFSKKNC